MKTLKQQKGVTLIIALAMLLLISMMGVGAMKSGILQGKMSFNTQSGEIAFQSAESAIRSAEAWLLNQTAPPPEVTGCNATDCVHPANATNYIEDNDDNWWANNSVVFNDGQLLGVSQQPRYVIEYIGYVPDTLDTGASPPTGRHYYLISAIGYGTVNTQQRILQSTYMRRF